VIRPPRLTPGQPVAVVAPAGPVPRDAFEAGARILGARYPLVYEERLFDRTGFLAGDDAARLAELRAALADPSVGAVFCARGGYGLMRLIDRLDGAAFAAAPKPIVGFSDVTALHAWALHAGVAAVHGPVVTQLARVPDEDVAALFALLESPAPPPPLTGLRALATGRAEGRLVGGNLELVTRLLGTPFALPLEGAVLLLEEIGERPYRLDRALTQLRLSAGFDAVRAVVVGDLVGCGEPNDAAHPTPDAVVEERLGGLGIPVVAQAPVGHDRRNRALPLGARAIVDAAAGTVELLDGAVS
jgi:muramoyltetrapeptide carboxypeptidase